jgi:hypothetical protein
MCSMWSTGKVSGLMWEEMLENSLLINFNYKMN